jgi:hypothetical protein
LPLLDTDTFYVLKLYLFAWFPFIHSFLLIIVKYKRSQPYLPIKSSMAAACVESVHQVQLVDDRDRDSNDVENGGGDDRAGVA